MFSKVAQQQDRTSDYSHTFFRRYSAVASLYTVVGAEKTLRLKDARVFFTTEHKSYDFFIVVQSHDPQDTKNKYLFPVQPDMDMCCFMPQGSKSVIFEWKADGATFLQLEFVVYNEDFDHSIKFRNNIIRLLYQVANKRSFTECSNMDQIEQFCPMKDTSVQKTPPEVTAAFEKLIGDNSVEFASIGELVSLKPEEADSRPVLISPHYIMLIRKVGDYDFEIQIYDQTAKQLYTVGVNEALKFYVNCDTNSLQWTDHKGGNTVHLSFKLRESQASTTLQVILSMAVMQSMKKQKFDDIVKNSDWNQYYGNASNQDEEVIDQPEYSKYVDNTRMDVEFSKDNTFVEPTNFKGLKHSDLAQGKTIDRTFVTQENNVSVYQAFDDDHFNVRSIDLVHLQPASSEDSPRRKPWAQKAASDRAGYQVLDA